MFVVVGGVDSQGETDGTLLGVSVCLLWWEVLTARVRDGTLLGVSVCLLWWEVLTASVRQAGLC